MQVATASINGRPCVSGACRVGSYAAVQRMNGPQLTAYYCTTQKYVVGLQATQLTSARRSCSCKSVLSPIFGKFVHHCCCTLSCKLPVPTAARPSICCAGIVFNPILIGIIWAIGATKFVLYSCIVSVHGKALLHLPPSFADSGRIIVNHIHTG